MDGGTCRSEGFVVGEHVPDRRAEVTGKLDARDLRATLAAEPPVIVGVERDNHGHAVLQRLRDLHRGSAPYTIFRARDGRVGWLTSSASRPVLIDQLEAAVRTGELTLHDAGTLDRFGTFAWSDDGRPEGQEGYRDDDVLAAGIAWQVRRRAFGRVLGARPTEPVAV